MVEVLRGGGSALSAGSAPSLRSGRTGHASPRPRRRGGDGLDEERAPDGVHAMVVGPKPLRQTTSLQALWVLRGFLGRLETFSAPPAPLPAPVAMGV